jgi:hypothetical protein
MPDPRLQQLVDARRFDELLELVSLSDVATAWIQYQHDHARDFDPADVPEADPNWWAVETWMQPEWWADEHRVRAGILDLVAAAQTDLDFGCIGAGIMEEFINEDLNRLGWLETQAARSIRFRTALANVYIWGQLRDEIATRVEAAAGVRLPRPRGWTGP